MNKVENKQFEAHSLFLFLNPASHRSGDNDGNHDDDDDGDGDESSLMMVMMMKTL